MNLSINFSSLKPMLEIIKDIKNGVVNEPQVRKLIEHEDYAFEFSRYGARVEKEQFINYIINIYNLDENDIKNPDLKAHHKYYVDLLNNIDYYIDKEHTLERILTKELFEGRINHALNGLPNNTVVPDLKFIFTLGIGGSFGYAHGNGTHYDFLQLMKNQSLESFSFTISHEFHHVIMYKILEELFSKPLSLESKFYLEFVSEGLAVKYCNNAEGILSKAIYPGEKNIGLDKFTWDYLLNDFDNSINKFKETIHQIREGSLTEEGLEKQISSYWNNRYTEGQKSDEIPKLCHFRSYSLGTDIWGVIHDCFGKDVVYETVKNPSNFPNVFNRAMEIIHREDLKI